MTTNEKKEVILKEITRNYDNLKSQCLNKLRSYRVLPNCNHHELLSEILYNFLEKLEEPDFAERIYEIYEKDKLISFLGKSIDNNARHLSAPFLQKKLKRIFNETEFSEIYYTIEEEPDLDENGYLVDEVNKAIQEIEDKNLLGTLTWYYIKLFRDYTGEVKVSYKDLSQRYGISVPTIKRDMMYTKKSILIVLRKNNVEQPSNRIRKFYL